MKLFIDNDNRHEEKGMKRVKLSLSALTKADLDFCFCIFNEEYIDYSLTSPMIHANILPLPYFAISCTPADVPIRHHEEV